MIPSSISSHNNIGLNLDLVRISQIKFYNGSPVSRHIGTCFKLLFAEASFTECTFVICAVSLTTALCGI